VTLFGLVWLYPNAVIPVVDSGATLFGQSCNSTQVTPS
jgi:hypothetical protein